MCNFFDDGDFDGDDSCDDNYDNGMEDSMDSEFNEDLIQDDDQSDRLSWDAAYWIGTGIGFAYEEGKRERRRRKINDSDDPS